MSFATLASNDLLEKTITSLKDKGYTVHTVKTKEEALSVLVSAIPDNASVMNGSSVTLEQIGFIDLLKSDKHTWNNLHAAIVTETDLDKKTHLRKQALLADYYVGSVHALASNGDYLVASNTGSQLPHIVNSSKNLVFVVSTRKIVENEKDMFIRLTEYVVPLEDKHMQELYNVHTTLNKIVISKGESPLGGRSVTFILVDTELGF